jgi:uncharacterized membrane protein YeaQ/YmgE (transglycosylase-associated protein family)
MNILAWIVLGGISGWAASMVMSTSHSAIIDILLGIVGAFIGGFIMNTFFSQPGVTGFNAYSLLVAFIGAVVLIFIGRLF